MFVSLLQNRVEEFVFRLGFALKYVGVEKDRYHIRINLELTSRVTH